MIAMIKQTIIAIKIFVAVIIFVMMISVELLVYCSTASYCRIVRNFSCGLWTVIGSVSLNY